MIAFAARAAGQSRESGATVMRTLRGTPTSVGGRRNRQRDSGEALVSTGDVGSGQEGVAGARCVVLGLT